MAIVFTFAVFIFFTVGIKGPCTIYVIPIGFYWLKYIGFILGSIGVNIGCIGVHNGINRLK